MANAVSVLPFSASTQGQGIKLVATSTPGTLIHTTGTSATVLDQVWLYAFNSDTVPRTITVEFGGATAPDQNIVLPIPSQAGLTLVVPGLSLTGNGSVALTVKAFCPTTAVVTVSGFVNRITP